MRLDPATGRCDACPCLDLGYCRGTANPRLCALAHGGQPVHLRQVRAASIRRAPVAGSARTRWRPRPGATGPVRAGFLRHYAARTGGIETWHATLLPRLDPRRVDLQGEAALVADSVMPGSMPTGPDAVADLAARCEVVVCCGFDPGPYLPEGDRRPGVVMLSHGQEGDPWTSAWMTAARDTGDVFACVHACGLGSLPPEHRDRGVVVESGFDPARAAPRLSRAEARRALGLPPGRFVAGYLGRMTPEKRPALPIRAMRHLDPARFLLVVAGGGWCEEDARAAAAGLEDRVVLLGPRDDVPDILAALDCLASPSREEGFGLSMVEAMAAGVPLVGTPRGVLSDRPDLARIVPVEAGPEAWAAAFVAERDDPAGSSERAALARSVALDRWSADAFARRWSRLLWRTGRCHPDYVESVRRAARGELIRGAHDCGCRGPAVTVADGGQ